MTLADSSAPSPLAGRDLVVDLTRATNPATAAPAPNLVGRAAELERLGAAFEVASGGRALAVLVGGDAGIGKSRLVEEFCDRARLGGALVATGVCVPADGGLAFAPVMGILRDIERHLRHSPSATELLHALGADVGIGSAQTAAAGDLPTAPAPDMRAFAKTALFESILQSVVELAQAAPVVLVFEDLHWADSASSQLFDFLVRNLGDARVLVVGTHRSDELGHDHPLTAWLAELGRHTRVQQLLLGPLDRAELATLMTDSLGARPGADVLDSVWTRSQGNPFFAEELLAGGDASSLPTALQSVINNRVKQLPEPAQDLLAVVAAAGAVVDHHLVVAISGSDAEGLDTSIAAAIDKKILVVDESGSGYRFRHALIREAVYDALLPARRSRLHHGIAVALAGDATLGSSAPGHRIAELASHWWASGDWAAALTPSIQAADAAIAMFAFPEALTFLEHALLAVDRVSEATAGAGITRAQLLEKAADVAYFAGANARAVELAQAAIDAVDADAEPVVAARCYTMLGRNMWGVGDSASAFAAYRTAIELLPADSPSVELARLLAEEARGYMLISRFVEGEELAREAIAVARAVNARDIEGSALNTLGCCRGCLGFGDEAIAMLQESLAIAEDLANPEDVNRAYGNLASLLLDYGRLDEAASIMFDGAAVGEQIWGVRLNGAAGNGVDALVRLGRYAEAEDVLAQLGTQSLGVCAHGPWSLPAAMMVRRGRFDVAEQLIATAQDVTALLDDVQVSAALLGLAAELELERERPDDAAPHLEQALVLVARSDDVTLGPELCMWAARAVADQCEAALVRGRSPDVESMRRRCDEIVAIARGAIDEPETRGGGPALVRWPRTRKQRPSARASTNPIRIYGTPRRAVGKSRTSPTPRRTAGGGKRRLCSRAGEPRAGGRVPQPGLADQPRTRPGAAFCSHRSARPARPPRAAGQRAVRAVHRISGWHRSRTDGARGRGARPARCRAQRPRDRRGAVHQQEDGERARVERVAEAVRRGSGGGRQDRPSPRPRRVAR